MPVTTKTFLQAALDYAAQDWPVFPCKPEDKSPLTLHGHLDATTDEQTIRAWWKQHPNAMIGVPMGPRTDTFCTDLDIKENVNGRQTWSALVAANDGVDPITRLHDTPSGGQHRLYKWGPGIRSIGLNTLAEGLEIKGDGGYIVVPPSVRDNGKSYVSNGLEIVAAPEWLLEMMYGYWQRRNGRSAENASTEDAGTMDPELEKEIEGDYGKGISFNPNDYYEEDTSLEKVRFALEAYRPDYYYPWWETGSALHKAGFSFDLWVGWSRTTTRQNFDLNACRRKWQKEFPKITGFNINTVFGYADEADRSWRDRYEEFRGKRRQRRFDHGSGSAEDGGHHARQQEQRQTHDQTKPKLLHVIDTTGWDDAPAPEPEYEVPNRVPTRQITLLSGEGGAGKSILFMQLMACTVLQQDWLGATPRPGSALFIEAEDGEQAIRYRMEKILRYYKSSFQAVRSRLHLITKHGEDAVLGYYSRRTSKVVDTPLYQELLEMVGDLKPRIIGLASSANVFAGEEINRTQVQQFIGLLTQITHRSNGGLVLITHPSLVGIQTGTGLSGSTQWHNAVRARAVMTGDQKSSLRKLEFHKNQYGPVADSVNLCWNEGLFLPVGAEDAAAVNRLEQAKQVFMIILRRFRKHKLKASPNPGPGYAPKQFAEQQEAKTAKLNREDFIRTMNTLLEENIIKVETYRGTGRHAHEELIIVGEQASFDGV